MKMSTLSSLFVLMSVVSMVAIAPSAFADHENVTVQMAVGSGVPDSCTTECYLPSTVTIDVGGTVTWDNIDAMAHTASSGITSDDDAGSEFDTSFLMAGKSYTATFDTAGTYPYFCNLHPWMVGTVIVEDAAAAEAEAADAAAAEAAAAEAAAIEAAAAEAAAMAAPSIDAADYISASGASVTSITANADDDSVIIAIDATDDGVLSVTLHSEVITAFDDGTYFVLINNEEVEFEQSGNNLTIPYEAGNERVEIVGSHAVPEFGTIAMIILAVAIVSIIAITAKTRTTLIPKL